MERSWYLRVAMIVGLVLLGLYVSMPSFIYLSSEPKVRRDKVALKKAIPNGANLAQRRKIDEGQTVTESEKSMTNRSNIAERRQINAARWRLHFSSCIFCDFLLFI